MTLLGYCLHGAFRNRAPAAWNISAETSVSCKKVKARNAKAKHKDSRTGITVDDMAQPRSCPSVSERAREYQRGVPFTGSARSGGGVFVLFGLSVCLKLGSSRWRPIWPPHTKCCSCLFSMACPRFFRAFLLLSRGAGRPRGRHVQSPQSVQKERAKLELSAKTCMGCFYSLATLSCSHLAAKPRNKLCRFSIDGKT